MDEDVRRIDSRVGIVQLGSRTIAMLIMGALPTTDSTECANRQCRCTVAIPRMMLVALSMLILVSCVKRNRGDVARQEIKPIEITSKTGVALVLIPGGEFRMGSDTDRPDESPRHAVQVSPFAIDKYEVTQREFATLELPDPSQFKSPERPVEQIRWVSAAEHCNERSNAEGFEACYDAVTFECNFEASGYRLPTESEWEYAARSGVDDDDSPAGSSQKLRSYACYAGNSKKKTDTVGSKRPNSWGLHDMLGNVTEWCNDNYSESYYAHSPLADPRGPSTGETRVIRGGSWNSGETSCRVSAREERVAGFTDACFTGNTLGFRCVRRLTADEFRRLQEANPDLMDSALIGHALDDQ